MLSPVEELKIQAKRLLKEPSFKAELLVLSKNRNPQLKHSQLFIARHYGFRDWEHARTILSCEGYGPGADCGSFWYANQCATLLNHWCANHLEALNVQLALGGIILPYKAQFVVADRQYLEFLGMNYDDVLWQDIQHDWCLGPVFTRQKLALKRLLRRA